MVAESSTLGDVIEALGWTLLHFVWQGTVVGLLAAMVLAMLRRCSASARYLTSVAMLCVLCAMPLLTMSLMERATSAAPLSDIMATKSWVELDSPSGAESVSTAAAAPNTATTPLKVERIGIDFENPPSLDAVPLIPISESSQSLLDELSDRQPSPSFVLMLKPMIPWIVRTWFFGVVLLSLRFFVGWWRVQRLRRQASLPASDIWQKALRQLAERLRVTRPVQLVESVLVEVPTVIGWLRPVILLPATAITGLTTEQLEALLAHELAHVRRHDYLINLLQTIVETLLFYHPAVWWLSHRIRAEREHCCDDLAVTVCGDKVAYAKALLALEELRSPAARFALSSKGGSLLGRISRIIDQPQLNNRPSGWAVGVAIVAIVVTLLSLAVLSPRATEAKSANEFTITLPNGVQIELLGVSRHQLEGKTWWRPDGTPLKQAPTDVTMEFFEDFKDGFEIAFRWKCLKELTSSRLSVVMTLEPETSPTRSQSTENMGGTEGTGIDLSRIDLQRQKTAACVVTVFESEDQGGVEKDKTESEEDEDHYDNQFTVRFENVSLIARQQTNVIVRVDDREQTLAMRVRSAAQALSDVRMKVAVEYAANPLIASGITSDSPRELVRWRNSWQWLRSGSMWRLDHDGQKNYRGSTHPERDEWATGFDGEKQFIWYKADNELLLGSSSGRAAEYAPQNLFWNPMGGGLEPYLKSLARPDVRTKPETFLDLKGLRVESVSDHDPTRRWSAFISLQRGYLAVEMKQFHNDQLEWETHLSDLREAAPGIWAPQTIQRTAYFYASDGEQRIASKQTYNIDPFQIVSVGSNATGSKVASTKIALEEFRFQPAFGMTIRDHTQGISYHNDPWWEDLTLFLREKCYWPQRSIAVLDVLHSNLQKPVKEIRLPESELVMVYGGGSPPDNERGYALTTKINWPDHKGKVTLIVFWDSRDDRSGELLVALENLKWHYWHKNFEIVAIHRPVRFAAVEPLIRQRPSQFPVYIDADNASHEGVVRDTFSSRGSPSAVLLDHELKLHPILNARELPEQLTALMTAAGDPEPPTFKLIERLPDEATVAIRSEWLSLVAKAPKTSRISGQVRDDQGKPLVGAKIELLLRLTLIDSTRGHERTIPDPAGKRTTETNSTGEFAFADLPKGEYELTISSPNRTVKKQQVIVADGQSKELSVVLTPLVVDSCRSDQPKEDGDKVRAAKSAADENEAQLTLLRNRTDNSVSVKFAKVCAEVAKAEWDKIVEANCIVPGAISDAEVERARLNYVKAALLIEQAEHQQHVQSVMEFGLRKSDELELTRKSLELLDRMAKVDADIAKAECDRAIEAKRRLSNTTEVGSRLNWQKALLAAEDIEVQLREAQRLEQLKQQQERRAGQFVGRVRLKTEQKLLPDLEKANLLAGRVPDDSLVFSKDGGLANVFVYLWKPKFKIDEQHEVGPRQRFVLTARGGRYEPHAAVVRVGQSLEFVNDQPVSDNLRSMPLKSNPLNRSFPANGRLDLTPFTVAENLPVSMKSDIHPWMQAYLFPLDHPFATVTDADGRFEINGLPPGEHEFRLWHERVGYLEKSYRITIKPNEGVQTEFQYEPTRLSLGREQVEAD